MTASPLMAGTIHRANRNGAVVEQVPVREDGSFVFTGDISREVERAMARARRHVE